MDSAPAEVAGEASATLVAEQVVYVGTPVTLSAADSSGDTFTWDFGDGVEEAGAEVSHVWTAPGRYSLRLTAAAGSDSDIAAGTVVAVNTPLAEAPTVGGKLALSDGRLYAIVPDSDEVVVIEDNAVVERLDTCERPVSLGAAAGVLAVACATDVVEVWDTATLTLVQTYPLHWGARPAGVVVGAGGEVWAALSGTGEVVALGGGEGTTVATLPDARALTAGGGAVFATRFRSAEEAGSVVRVDAGGATTFGVARDAGPDSDTDARGLPSYLQAAALSPDGTILAVGGLKANVERGLVRDGLALNNEVVTRSSTKLLDAVTGEERDRALFDNRDQVGALAWSPLGDRLFAAHLGTGIVDILDPFSMSRLGGYQGVGVGLDGLVTDGTTLWVLASWDRVIVGYDLSAGNAQVEVARIALVEEEPLDATLLLGGRIFHSAGDSRMSLDGYLSCASCHLEGDGDGRTWDFTDRGEGLRNTLPLYAAPPAGPFHWSANFDELQDFEGDIRKGQGGTGYMGDDDWAGCSESLGPEKAGISADLDALAAYVASFQGKVPRSPHREVDGSPTASGLRGAAVFVEAGCDTCHAGAWYTDAGMSDGAPVLHDVGTLLDTSGGRLGGELTGLRTPGLRGLFDSAPYLHDGRAATVEEALAEHGVGGLPGEADLVQFLLEIE